MKVLITGASGLLGRQLMKRFSNDDTIGWAFSRSGENLEKVDLNNHQQVSDRISAIEPDIIIHAAAERRPDICSQDPDAANKLNVEATQNLAKAAKACGAWILYLSTDYVFDGTQPPYRPNDQTNPINFYGKSKLAGENAIKAVTNRYGVLRVGMLYGPVEYLGESAVICLLELLDKDQGKVDDFCQRYPTHTADVAIVYWELAQRAYADQRFNGTWHLCTEKALTKYELLRIMAKQLDKRMDHIEAIDTPMDDGPRPVNCAFDCSDLFELKIEKPRAFEVGFQAIDTVIPVGAVSPKNS